MGNAQAGQWRAQLVGQGAQQHPLLAQALAQTLGHVLEGLRQLTEFVTSVEQWHTRPVAVQVVGA
ncbi:hypothetical protein D3C84_894740 [compost metagenome]